MNVWDAERVAEFLLPCIVKRSITPVVTFDSYGVSGHPNHIALYNAVVALRKTAQLPNHIQTYILQSVPLWSKFIGPLAILEHEGTRLLAQRGGEGDSLVTASMDLPLVARSLFAHRSQAVWFRWLFVVFGRYSFVNVLQRLPSSEALVSRQ